MRRAEDRRQKDWGQESEARSQEVSDRRVRKRTGFWEKKLKTES
jgi:hypothetical protein